MAAELNNFTFGLTDFTVFVIMLLTSIAIGVYFGFFSKVKNTTEEYLMGGKKMKTIPIAISLVASQLSGIAIMSVPAENYAYGFNYLFYMASMACVVPILCYVVTPVFYENNISNCYEYLQKRFNKQTRQIVTGCFVLHAFLVMPVIIFVPSLAFAQVTNINIHLTNAIVCAICVFYTMIGGIKAVVWTDVVQAGIMLSSVVLVAVLGTLKVGGLAKVLEYASEGGRLDVHFSLDPRARITIWNALISGTIMWTGHVGLNQSCVQRIVSLPSLAQAKRCLQLAGFGIILLMSLNCFIGIVMYARYHGCDPILAGLVSKADKLVPFFVQDVMGHLKGMSGVFISCVFSAALSTMSALLNSLAGVVYFDYIKPYVKHTDEKANTIMKCLIIAMGIFCIAGGLVVENFQSILQLVLTISGVTAGAVVGIFMIGMFVPRVNGKVAVVSISFSLIAMALLAIQSQILISKGVIKYDPLPTTIERCDAENINFVATSIFHPHTSTNTSLITSHTTSTTTDFYTNRTFSIFESSFYCYKIYGVLLVWLIAIPLSFIWKQQEEKLDPKLYSPFVRKFIGTRIIEMEEMPLKNEPITINIIPDDKQLDKAIKQ